MTVESQLKIGLEFAHDAGWVFQKNGTAWCPEHNPRMARRLAGT